MTLAIVALLAAALGAGDHMAPATLLITDCSGLDPWHAAPWPDRDDAAATSKVSLAAADGGPDHPSALRVEYDFPTDRCTQVRMDLALPPCDNYAQLAFWVRGDGSGNVLEVWTGEQARGWHGAGHLPLDFTGWREAVLPLDDNFTALAHTLRFIVRLAEGLRAHTLLLDDVLLREPVDRELPPDFSVGPDLPGPPPFFLATECRLEKRRAGDRTLALLDDAPLLCVLDALPSAEYLQLARRAGVNCFALDLYWRDLEPLRGFHNWQRLRRFVDWLGQAGFAVALLVNLHQPRWLLARRGDEPLHQMTLYPNAPLVREEFTRFLKSFLPEFATARHVVIVGVSAGGEADANFPEVPGDHTPWRESPTLLGDFRDFLATKYTGDDQWRKAWSLEAGEQTMAQAVPPEPLGGGRGPWEDLRRPWHDWREFADRWWLPTTGWQARLVRELMPGPMVMVRFGWPVFQCENVFLAREAAHVDLLQCKDAVPTWEAATPWFLVSRAALYHGAVRGTDKVSFPEVDVGHNRGRPSAEDMTTYLPPLAPWIGALWYYRGLHESFLDGLAHAFGQLTSAVPRPSEPRIALFYGQKYANWTQHHANYANEAALAGAARVLGEAGLGFTVVSEYTLGDLRDMAAVVLADNPILPRQAAAALQHFAAAAGVLVVEDAERRDLDGSPCPLPLPDSALRVPAGFFASVQPRGEGLTLTAAQQEVARRTVDYLRRALSR